MRLLLVPLLGLMAAGAVVPAERPAGAPGTPTPQPYVQPQLRNLPSSAASGPVLLRQDSGSAGTWLKSPGGTLAPPDGELPLLQEQRRRNAQGLPGDAD